MPIQRSGPTPNYCDYITKYALMPYFNQGDLKVLLSRNPDFIEIPKFQRGVSWKVSDIQDLYNSESILLGNVIMGQFSIPENLKINFRNLPNTITKYHYLVDGLQRFSVGTIMLNVLWDFVLKQGCEYPNEYEHFQTLSAFVGNFAPIFLHNHQELYNHKRIAIKHPYQNLYRDFSDFLREEFAAGRSFELAQNIQKLFLDRQVAIDVYFNFIDTLQIMSTFIGINNTGVSLSQADLVRSYIIERGENSNWSSSQIELIENKFTEVFTTSNGSLDINLKPFMGVVWKAIETRDWNKIFPSWSTGLSFREVEDFLIFIDTFNSILQNNGYLLEIKNTGAAPFSILLSLYYYKFITTGTQPSFFTNRGTNENSDLHKLLISFYRATIEGGIGKSRFIAEQILLNASYFKDVSDVANDICMRFSNLSINNTYNADYLRNILNKSDKTKSKLVFNMMLLSDKSLGFGLSFNPIIYGASVINRDFNIDHLIPDAMSVDSQPGFYEINSIRNFSPLPCNLNRTAQATSCSSKLNNQGIYFSYINNPQGYFIHPFSKWLVEQHFPEFQATQFDNQENLMQGAIYEIGQARIDYIVCQLVDKL